MLQGQWIGIHQGTYPGSIIVNIDRLYNMYDGVAFICGESLTSNPVIVAEFSTANRGESFDVTANYLASFDHAVISFSSWESVKNKFPGQLFPDRVNIKGRIEGDNLFLEWETDVNSNGQALLPRSKSTRPSEYMPEPGVRTWDDYKKFVKDCFKQKKIYRGQSSNAWRLRTTFHRTQRANLGKFNSNDIRELHRRLSSKLYLDIDKADQRGAFYCLLQHHGYPTPLLDWSYSPYVAAFFAYRNAFINDSISDESNKVRIFIFDHYLWHKNMIKFSNIEVPFRHLSFLELHTFFNERVVPQQAVSTVTNVDDIEDYIMSEESDENKYLRIVDLPVSNRNEVMEELAYMGITAGSMFPGLDGTCEELKERLFNLI